MKKASKFVALIVFFWIMMVITTFMSLSACTDESASRRALMNHGFTQIRFTGYKMWSCGEDDTYATGFVARNPNGHMVSGVVCCGISKSCTIRF